MARAREKNNGSLWGSDPGPRRTTGALAVCPKFSRVVLDTRVVPVEVPVVMVPTVVDEAIDVDVVDEAVVDEAVAVLVDEVGALLDRLKRTRLTPPLPTSRRASNAMARSRFLKLRRFLFEVEARPMTNLT